MNTGYDTRRGLQQASGNSDAAADLSLVHDQAAIEATLGAVMAHFVRQRTSLRQWAFMWAQTHTAPDGSPYHPGRVYRLLRMTLVRWSGRPGAPRSDSLGRRLWADLSAEVGAAILPPLPEDAP